MSPTGRGTRRPQHDGHCWVCGGSPRGAAWLTGDREAASRRLVQVRAGPTRPVGAAVAPHSPGSSSEYQFEWLSRLRATYASLHVPRGARKSSRVGHFFRPHKLASPQLPLSSDRTHSLLLEFPPTSSSHLLSPPLSSSLSQINITAVVFRMSWRAKVEWRGDMLLAGSTRVAQCDAIVNDYSTRSGDAPLRQAQPQQRFAIEQLAASGRSQPGWRQECSERGPAVVAAVAAAAAAATAAVGTSTTSDSNRKWSTRCLGGGQTAAQPRGSPRDPGWISAMLLRMITPPCPGRADYSLAAVDFGHPAGAERDRQRDPRTLCARKVRPQGKAGLRDLKAVPFFL